MQRHRSVAASTAILALALVACTTDVVPPAALSSVGARAARILVEVEKQVPDLDFDEADKDLNKIACVKETPDGDLVLREGNANTPSQYCPPPFEQIGKGGTLKFLKEYHDDDVNLNGVVCVKLTGGDKSIVKDDNEATPSQPCPPAFYTVTGKAIGKKVPFELAAEADDNFNMQVCLHVTASGNFVVKDDDLDLPSQPCPPAYSVEPVGKQKPPLEEPKG
jgi:hypothetical protein